MQSIELTGKSVEEIRSKAAAHFGVPQERVEVRILEEKRGLLGLLGAREIRAEAYLREEAAEVAARVGVATAASPPQERAVLDQDAELTSAEAREDELARIAHRAEQVTDRILKLMGIAVTAQARGISEEEVRIELTGDDIALVIGKHGDTLDALQLLVAMIVNRGAHRPTRVVLDAEQYRERRRRALESAARAHAAKAKQTGREVVIRDLKAFERRIIHLALRDDPEVETYSEGEGRHRNLVISPISARRVLRERPDENHQASAE